MSGVGSSSALATCEMSQVLPEGVIFLGAPYMLLKVKLFYTVQNYPLHRKDRIYVIIVVGWKFGPFRTILTF